MMSEEISIDCRQLKEEELRYHVKELRTQTRSFTSTQNSDGSQSPNKTKSRWIRGKLTPWPTSVKKELWLGYLYMEDETGAVPCEMSAGLIALDDIGSEIFCHLWQYICDEGSRQACLEVTCWEKDTRVDQHPPSPTPTRCVTVTTAASLLQNKDRLKTKSVDLIGKVSYLSEIIRIKGDPLFMVQLEDSDSVINILVKRAEFLYWQRFLEPQKKFTFTGLRPTTLHKGTEQETRLFVPTQSSQLLGCEGAIAEPISLQEWLHCHGEADKDISQWTPATSLPLTGRQKLYSYKGTISAVEDIQNGIYEMDGKIRLYLSYIHAVHKFPQLRPGAEVLVYNVHHIAATQPPKVRLCCCLVSCVKVTRFARSDLINKRFEHAASHVIHLANQRGIHVHQVDWVRTLQGDLRQRLAPHHVRASEVGSVLYKMLTIPRVSSGACFFSGSPRNMLQEFLRPDHSGCHVIPREAHFEPQFSLSSVENLKKLGETAAKDLTQLRRHLASGPTAAPTLSDAACWTYEVLNPLDPDPPLVIVGVITIDPVTGQVQLKDHSGCIDCVIAQSSWQSSTSSPPSDPPGCPLLLLPRHLGRVVRLDRCRIVTERFLTPCEFNWKNCEVSDSALLDRVRVRVYLQFSMENVVFLSKPRDWLKQGILDPPRAAPNVQGQLKRAAQGCDLDEGVEVRVKRQRTGLDYSKEAPNGVFDLEGKGGRTDRVEKDEQVSYSSQLLVLTQKDSLHVRSRTTQSPSLCFYAAACLINPPVNHNTANHNHDHIQGTRPKADGQGGEKGDRLPVRHVALSFQHGAVSWYHLLALGEVYRLVSCRPLTATQAGPVGLQRAVNRADVRQCVPVTADTLLVTVSGEPCGPLSHLQQLTEDESRLCERVKEQLRSSGKIPEFISVHQALNSETEAPVHVQGVVVSRHFTRSQHQRAPHLLAAEEDTNYRLGVSVPGGFHLCLTLADIDRPQVRLKLYLNPSHVSYPLGLLDGAIVSVSRAQLKRSRRSAPYCQLLVASALRIVSLPGGPTVNSAQRLGPPDGSDGVGGDLTSLPLTHLADLWRRKEEGTTDFRCVVHVHKVLYVRLWSDCATCGNMHKLGQCSYMPCRSTTSPNVKVKASVVVDDGTTSAFLTCAGDDNVRSLLDLDATQWGALKLTAEDQGEVEFNQTSSSGRCEGLSPAMERLLAALCESWLVKRRLTVLARLTTFSSKGRWPRAAGVTGARPTPQLNCLRLQPAGPTEQLNDLLNDLLITGS